MKGTGLSWICLPLLLAASPALAQPFGLSGPEFRVNSYTTFDQSLPAVAVDGAGTAFAAWVSNGGLDGHNFGVFARRFASNGVPLGTDFRVNTFTTDDQFAPAVAAIGTGGFVVV